MAEFYNIKFILFVTVECVEWDAAYEYDKKFGWTMPVYILRPT